MKFLRGRISLFFTLICLSMSHHGVHAHSPEEPPKMVRQHLPKSSSPSDIENQPNLGAWIASAEILYEELDKSTCTVSLKPEIFLKAYMGMYNLKRAHILDDHSNLLTIVDYSLSANVPRLWIIDIVNKKVLYNTLVSHGQGSGEEYAVNFSNRPNSHQTSLGFFLTDTTYNGRNGYSMRLHGLDKGYNDRALERAIVIHGAPYVSERFISEHKRLGRSWGCPALPPELNREIIDLIKGGSLFFAYYPEDNYLASSLWLNPPVIRTSPGSSRPVLHAQHVSDSSSAPAAPSNAL